MQATLVQATTFFTQLFESLTLRLHFDMDLNLDCFVFIISSRMTDGCTDD
jgi:hypothetical protein